MGAQCERKMFFPLHQRFGKTEKQVKDAVAYLTEAVGRLPKGKKIHVFCGTPTHRDRLKAALDAKSLRHIEFSVQRRA